MNKLILSLFAIFIVSVIYTSCTQGSAQANSSIQIASTNSIEYKIAIEKEKLRKRDSCIRVKQKKDSILLKKQELEIKRIKERQKKIEKDTSILFAKII